MALGGRALEAQQLAGTLHRSTDSTPVAGALVLLADTSGRLFARTMSSERGGFVFALAEGGTYRLRVLRIGHRPWESRPLAVPAAGRAVFTVYVTELPIVLPPLTVTADAGRCGAPTQGSAVALLLGEAEKALTLTQATLEERRHIFTVDVWRRRLRSDFATLDSVGGTSTDRGWPIRSAPPESLRVWGFVREEPDERGNASMVYYGPDAHVLFRDWFLAGHCLRARSSEQGSSLVIVEFAPAHLGRTVDIAGRLVFDSVSLELRELSFRWVGLPEWVPRSGPGGLLRFRRLPSGEWLATEWTLRAPVPEMAETARGYGLRFREYAEMGGRVATLRPTTAPPQLRPRPRTSL